MTNSLIEALTKQQSLYKKAFPLAGGITDIVSSFASYVPERPNTLSALISPTRFSWEKTLAENLASTNNLKALISPSSNLSQQMASIATLQSSLQSQLSVVDTFKNSFALSNAISKSYATVFKDISSNNDWEELAVIESATETANEIVENYVDADFQEQILTEVRNTIHEEFAPLIEQSKSPKVKSFLRELRDNLAFIMGAIALMMQVSDSSTLDSINSGVKQSLQNQEKIISNQEKTQDIIKSNTLKIDSLSAMFNEFTSSYNKSESKIHKRIANSDVHLRLKPKRKSLSLDVILKDMEVVVLDTNHRWITISYISPKSGKPMVGYSFKKYFKRIKN